MKPLHSTQYPKDRLLNPAFPYTRSEHTDIRATFARIQAQQAKQAPKLRRAK